MTHVAIVEDQSETRDGLAALLAATAEFRCTGAFACMEDAIRDFAGRAADEMPEVALIDLGLPGMSGIDGIRQLKECFSNLTLIVLTVYDDDDRIFNALCAGASGYLLKNTASSRLLEAVREAVNGGSPMSPGVARRVIERFRKFRAPDRSDHQLTPHQVRLLHMLVQGHSYKTAAAELRITVSGVAFHMRQIYSKLQVHSKSEAVAKALRDRIVS